jgi:hypothetical protein
MASNYQQVCENGHKITGQYSITSQDQQKFCRKCGANTIIACPNCDEKIQGDRFERRRSRLELVESPDVPSYCPNCGKPFPWTQKRIQTAIQIFAEFGDLEEEEKKTIEQDVENIAKDVPEAELSAMRIKRIWEKYGPICRELILELTSRTAAHILKGP